MQIYSSNLCPKSHLKLSPEFSVILRVVLAGMPTVPHGNREEDVLQLNACNMKKYLLGHQGSGQ